MVEARAGVEAAEPQMAACSEEDAEALYEYSRRGKLPQVQELLDRGVPPDRFMAYDGSTPIVIAARSGHGEVVKLLLERGASREAHTDDGSPLLIHAVSGSSDAAVQAVLDTGADANEENEDGVTPLILASDKGLLQVVQLLLARKADVSVVAEDWGSALDAAEAGGHTTVAQVLVAAGGKPAGAAQAAGGDTAPRKMAAGEKWGYDAFDGEKDF